MSRNKNKRDFSFKPRFKHFAPKEGTKESLTLLHEEIEAIFLMDYQGMYQEDAAKSMGVSRPTFSRIIKNARMKVATALINGKALEILDEKKEFVLAFVCEDKEKYGKLDLEASFVILVKIQESAIVDVKVFENPVHHSTLRPGSALPPLLEEEDVNYFITNKAGEGLKSSLLTRGIFIIKKESVSFEDILQLSKEL